MLPAQEAALGVRHQDRHPAIGIGETRDAEQLAVGVLGIAIRGPTVVIEITDRHETMLECRLGVPRIGERRTALAVGDDDGELRSCHPRKQHRKRGENLTMTRRASNCSEVLRAKSGQPAAPGTSSVNCESMGAHAPQGNPHRHRHVRSE